MLGKKYRQTVNVESYAALTARSSLVLDNTMDASVGLFNQITPNLSQAIYYPAQVSYMYNTDNCLLYGTLFKDLSLEGTAALKTHGTTLVSNWLSSVKGGNVSLVDSNLHAFYNRNNYFFEASCSSAQIAGFSILSKMGNWSAGSEVYVTAKEKSGGLSLGFSC